MKDGLLPVLATMLVGLLCTGAVSAQPAPSPDTPDTVEVEPYRSERGLGEHLLALPSTVLHYATRPLGAAVRWAEREGYLDREEGLFWSEDRRIGIFPLVGIGGPSRFSVGLAVRNKQLLGTEREADLRFRYANRDNFRTSFFFSNPMAPLGESGFLDVDLGYETDSREPLYLGRDGADLNRRTSYRRERAHALVDVGMEPNPRFGWNAALDYERVETGQGDGEKDEPLPGGAVLAGRGATELVTGQASVLWNATQSLPARASVGPLLYLRYSYTDAFDELFRYHFGRAEVQQYVPITFLKLHRRLALRARLDKYFPAGDDATVPFYRQATLGDRLGLRGARRHRFRDEGLVLGTAEYRYPIWDTWDALLFVDGGQTFGDFNEINATDWQWSYGVGVRLYSRSGVSLRLDLAFTPDNRRIYAEAEPNFLLSPRRRDLR
jgi:hypothetical protein